MSKSMAEAWMRRRRRKRKQTIPLSLEIAQLEEILEISKQARISTGDYVKSALQLCRTLELPKGVSQ